MPGQEEATLEGSPQDITKTQVPFFVKRILLFDFGAFLPHRTVCIS